jgi:hypothetical protein
MGRHALLILLPALLLAGCERAASPPAEGRDAHASLACTECHEGGLADGQKVAAVPSRACTRSGCHSVGGPEEVTLATVTFTHRHHGQSQGFAIGCAGCHTHASGSEPLTGSGDTCGLCHQKELSATRGEDCRLCHESPSHIGMTSQGVGVPHQGLPWIEGGCLRCHYEVTKPVHEVSMDRCRACHENVSAVAKAGIGEDLHPSHTGVACVACHEADSHRIEAMSSAVDLVCSDCHTEVHGIAVKSGPLDAASCDACHRTVHQAPQRVLLGITPDTGEAMPSPHFMDGLTCSSCHRARDGGKATAQACVGCHRPEFALVLRWWVDGIDQRMTMVRRYLAGADSAVVGRQETDAAVRAVADARRRLELIQRGGGVHNIPLTHRLFQDALADATQAYRDVGREPPKPPLLGRTPRRGICAFCHYRLPEPGFSQDMPDAFHRQVLSVVDQ